MTDTRTKHLANSRSPIGLVLVLLVTLLACLPALRNGFAQDGKILVQVEGNDRRPNPMVATLQPVVAYFGAEYWHGAAPSAGLYRPVTVLSFALVRRYLGGLLGDQALAQHLVDVLLHLLATALVWWLLRWLGLGTHGVLLGTAGFGLHAIHAEAIASVVGRAEILAFCGGGAGTLLAGAAWRGASWRRAAASVLATACFFAAYAAKESALPWAAFAPVLLSTQSKELRRWSAAAFAFACAAPPAVVFLLLRWQVLGASTEALTVMHAVNPLLAVETATRIATATVVWCYGAFKLVWPGWLISDYGGQTFELRASLFEPAAAGAALLLLALLAGSVVAWRRAPTLFLAGVGFLGFTLPTSNVPFVIGTIFAERLYYTPSLAVALVLAWLGSLRLPRVGLLAIGVWLAFSTWLLAARLGDWRDDATLLLHDVAANPRASRLHTAAAEMLAARGNLEEACAHTRQAVELDPDFAGAWSNLGSLLLDLGRPGEAEAALRRGRQSRWQNGAEQRFLHINLGRALLALERPREALVELEAAHRNDPGFAPVIVLMLDAASALADDALVRRLLVAGDAAAPGAPTWALHRGLLALRAGAAADAERELRLAVEGLPDDARARAALGEALQRQGKPR